MSSIWTCRKSSIKSATRVFSHECDFGFGGNILKWFSPYLENRYEQTIAFGVTSQPLLVSSGVPEGFILGPMLLLLYESDLTSAVTNSNIAMFANDTILFKEISLQMQIDANNQKNTILSTSRTNYNVQTEKQRWRKQKMNVTLVYGSRANSADQSTYLNNVCVPTECLATLRDRLITSRLLQYGKLCTLVW